MKKDYYSKFVSDQFYHIYNRANGSEKLFIEEKNYRFFLNRCDNYLADYLNIWAYCLIPNHFHFLIKVKSEDSLANLLKINQSSVSEMISNQFRNLFISYTKSFNNVYNRNGSLFQKPFKHVLVDSESYLFALIHYIHHNPIHHNFVNSFSEWKYSSYSAIIGKEATKISRNEVLNLFGVKMNSLLSPTK